VSDAAVYTGQAAVRAGVLVTGTEVLSGIISDRNGPWLSEQLRDLGVDVAMIEVVGDRPADMLTALRHMAAEGLAVIVTSGGLGPTADDLTAEVVGEFSGREMVLDEALEERIFEILKPLIPRWREADPVSVRAANRKQAVIPSGATVLEPQGTAPGLVVAPPAGSLGPTVVVLPGPPRELMPMWSDAIATEAFQLAISGATVYRREMVRLYGLPEAAIASTLRAADDAGVRLAELEITTCLRRGELEISTRFEPAAAKDYEQLLAFIEARHGDHIFSRDGSTIDEQVAAAMVAAGETIALAESCTGGLLAARLTERAGSSAYVLGGAVVYSNEAKTGMVGVEPSLIAAHGAVSVEVARALADGARARFGAAVGVGITGIAGPGGGTVEKPVGLVCFSVTYGSGGRVDAGTAAAASRVLTRSTQLPGDRAAVRDRATTVAMHLISRVLQGDSDQL
jgi:nicotinamide-nucleotide amidase